MSNGRAVCDDDCEKQFRRLLALDRDGDARDDANTAYRLRRDYRETVKAAWRAAELGCLR